MTQTVKGNNGAPQNQRPQKQYRPGQRQQERMRRAERRRRRQRILTAGIVSLVMIVLAIGGYVEFQRYSADQAAARQASANATATRIASIRATATAKALAACLAGLKTTPTPTAGPKNPPKVNGTPVKLPDGLQYIDIQVGCGTAAQAGSTVSVEYTGWLQSSGKKFDSSYDRGGQPFKFTPGQGQVIKGWDEGLLGMKQGGVRRLIIPAALAYAAQGRPPTIPPNATLIFDVTVLSVSG